MNNENTLAVENENLFRALVCLPMGILFSILAAYYGASSGLLMFKVIFVLLALAFSLYGLAYAAYYTNDRTENRASPFFSNSNLFKLVVSAPLAALFIAICANAVLTSAHIVFCLVYGGLAAYFALSALAYGAFYTNDCYGAEA